MLKKTFIILYLLLPLIGISQNGNTRFDCSSYIYNNNPLVISNDTVINVFPNPFDNSITITSINAGNIIITDLTGRIILQEKISSGVTKLDSSSWSSEMYIVTIKTENQTKTTKIIKK